MNRNVSVVPMHDNDALVIAADNSGSIGMREKDAVQVPYDVVSYYNFRVAWMECVAAGAVPFSAVLHNFCGDGAWSNLVEGIESGIKEASETDISLTGSTETNFEQEQSAVGLTIIGRRAQNTEPAPVYSMDIHVAVIGSPLVGPEVVERPDDIAPLWLFAWFSRQDETVALMPVGSKGILYELERLFAEQSLTFSSSLDLEKSSGPATCFVAVYREAISEKVKGQAGGWLHEVGIRQ